MTQPATQFYVYTLDSHICIGPFPSHDEAHRWAWSRQFTSYQLLTEPPFEFGTRLLPF